MTTKDEILERLRNYDGAQPGTVNMVSDVLDILADHLDRWTNRADDAKRIPDVIASVATELRRTEEISAPLLTSSGECGK